MNTIEIYQFLAKNKCIGKHFYGVYPIDKIPHRIWALPAFLVINMDRSDKPGTHWVAIYISRSRQAEFFDSYGRTPTRVEFKRFLKRNTERFTHNKTRFQSNFSMVCGQYCCMFLMYKCQGLAFVKKFGSKNLIKNDKKIIKEFEKVSGLRRVNNQHQLGFAQVQTCLPRKTK